ncbi:uncharacterized protein [Montipora foliosa]|uniref:uncharacterized protein isoform X2 n=1 Tax=Montipora foliosa TaxID=591990 RepID=UPI0035F180A8
MNNAVIFRMGTRVASRLVFIPFVTGPTSPDGLPAQQRAEEELSRHLKEAPRAMGTMLSLKLETILEAAKGLKTKIASLYPETDDRICENYGILLAMAEEPGAKAGQVDHHCPNHHHRCHHQKLFNVAFISQ